MVNLGIGYAIGYSAESAWGTAAGTVDNFFYTYAGQDGIQRSVATIRGEDLQDRGSLDTQIDPGSRFAQGPLGADLQYGGGWLMFPSMLCGEDPVTAGAGPYTHTQHLGADLGGGGGGTSNLDEGITCFIAKYGQTAAASQRAYRYIGGKPKAWEIAFAPDARARMTADMWFRDFDDWHAQFTPTLPTRSWINAPSQAAAPTDFLVYNGQAYRAIASTVKLEQDWEGLGDLQDPTANAHAIASQFKMTISATLEAPATSASSGGAFWDDYETKTPRSLVLTAEGPTAANESLVITAHAAVVSNPQDPPVPGAGVIRQNVEFECFYDVAQSEFGTMVLTSSDTAAWS